MSKLFDIVNEVINSNDLNEAEQKLFGVEGININSKEYFNNIVSNFIKKKEHIIIKENNNLVFDLNNYNDIWNIIFLGEYLKENNILYKEYNDLLIEIENLENEINNTIKEHRQVNTKQEHDLINQKVNTLKNKLNTHYDQMKKYKSLIDTFNNIDWVKLENTNDETEKLEAVKTLKQAINIIHKLRNSIQHGNTIIDKNIEINDDIFKVSIPIEYLDGFNKERIIAQEEDKIIVERTNLIASPLLESLGYDVKKVESFFYNVAPEYLNYLLEQVDYNYDELYKLNINIFTYSKVVQIFLLLGYSLYFVNTLPEKAFVDFPATIDFLREKINVLKLPTNAFSDSQYTLGLKANGFDIYKLPDKAFDCSIEELDILNESGLNIYKLPDLAFKYPKSTIKLHTKGLNIYNLSEGAFDNTESTIKLKEKDFDIYRLPSSAFHNPETTIELRKMGFDIYKLPSPAFENLKSVIKLYKENYDIYNLPDKAFEYPKSAIKLISKGFDINKLSRLAFYLPETAIDLYEKGFDIYNLPELAYRYHSVAIDLHEKGIDINKLPIPSREYSRPIGITHEVFKLPSPTFYNKKGIIKLHEEGIDIYRLPSSAFEFPKKVIKLYNNGIDIYKLPYSAFKQHADVIRLHEKGIEVDKLPERCFYYYLKIENIKYLLNLVDNNYDRLNEFPIEFFKCDISLIEEMYKTYNLNVARSIFGINNPKLIATLVYCDSVFKRYQKENNDRDIVDFAPMNFIKLGYENTLNYKNNISDKEMDSQTYLDQFMIDYDDNYRSQINVKSNILDKLRNSICHFRFKPVKDSNGKIVEDKIYLYDKFESSDNTNFNMIIDIKDLVAIVRTIEMGLEIKNNNADNEITEESSIHRKR